MRPNIGSVIQGRAVLQDQGTQETVLGRVTKTYSDSLGNITSADVRVPGQQNDIIGLPNTTGAKLYAGAQVTVNYNRGNRHFPQIIQVGSAGAAGTAYQSAQVSSASIPFGPNNLGNAPVLLEEPSAAAPNGYVVVPGSNIYLAITPPSVSDSGNVELPGAFEIFMLLQVLTSLPNPLTTQLLNGTLVNLVNSYGTSLGLYRLDTNRQVWVQILGPALIFVPYEVPSGAIDAGNRVFTLAYAPAQLMLYKGGAAQGQDATADYVLSGNQITYTVAPQIGDVHFASYWRSQT